MKHKLFTVMCLAFAGAVAVSQTTSPGGGGTTSGGTSVTQPGQATTGSGTLTPNQGTGAATQPGAFLPPQVGSTGTRTGTGGGFQTNSQFSNTTPGNPTATAQMPQNVKTAQLAARLAALQAEIQATLPLVASVSQEVLTVTTNQSAANTYVGRSGLGNRAAVGQGSTVAPVPPPRGISPRSIPLQGAAAASQTTVGAQTGVASGGTSVTPDTFRALVVLQTDLERMLPVLNTLNQGGAAGLSGTGAAFGTSTGVQAQPENRLGTQPPVGTTPPVGTPQAPFTPTGR